MSVHGTLDSFPVEEMFRFMSDTGRSGVLRIDGEGEWVRLWIEDGACVGAELDAVPLDEPILAVVAALRFPNGRFEILGADVPPRRLERSRLSEVLVDARELVSEWEVIEAVIPTRRHVVRPVSIPPVGRVVLDPVGWRLVTSIGESATVGRVLPVSGAGELESARALAALVRGGLLVVDAPPVEARRPEAEEPESLDPTTQALRDAEVLLAPGRSFPIDDLIEPSVSFDPLAGDGVDPEPSAGSSAPAATPFTPDAATAIAEVLDPVRSPTLPSETSNGGDPAFR